MLVKDLSLTHYSAEPLGELKPDASPPTANPGMKPTGFWVSVDGPQDWLEFCNSEGFCLDRLTHAHRITLAEDANILLLSSADELDAFTQEFGRDFEFKILLKPTFTIDWARVAERYQGIIISPYQWSRRLDPATMWYYGWDCASGCIWDVSAIKDVVLLESLGSPREPDRILPGFSKGS